MARHIPKLNTEIFYHILLRKTDKISEFTVTLHHRDLNETDITATLAPLKSVFSIWILSQV